MNWHLSTGRLSTIYPFQLQTPLHRVSPLPHLFTPFASQSQFTFHIVPLLGDRQKPLKWRSVLLRIPNGPSLTPRPLRSTVREFLSQRHPASSPSSVPKAGGRSDRMLGIKSEIRTPDTPNAGYTEFPTSNFRHPRTCHRKAMVAPSPNGAITGLTSPRYLKEDRPRSRNTAVARTKPEAAPRCDRLEAVESGIKHAAGLHRKLIPKRSRHPEAKGDKTPRRRGRTSS